jgi:acetylornithine deacetylase/succinyl-diaminopimelate desuccinylase-like protein
MARYVESEEEEAAVREILASSAIQRAFAFVDADGERMTRELVELCEIEAPPFHEEKRGTWFLERFRELGLAGVARDAAGNVAGVREGAEREPAVVLSAHLDTVFPPGTDCRVRREGTRLYAPGIGDDASGLAALLAVARALDAGGVRTRLPVVFLATVGEEGEGDLRGVRHFFEHDTRARGAAAFVSLDGPGVERITNRALGSRRFRVTFTGPGGHSWGDFGIVNPIHALGRAVARLASFPAPIEPRTTYNVGRIEGGRSVNAIPQEARMSVDLRSAAPAELDRLEAYFRRAVAEAAHDENRLGAPSGTTLGVRVEQIGDRPSGETSPATPLARIMVAASRALGVEPRFDCSSTDSNIPISLGIPAVTIGCGGQSANAHSLGEWFDPRGRDGSRRSRGRSVELPVASGRWPVIGKLE